MEENLRAKYLLLSLKTQIHTGMCVCICFSIYETSFLGHLGGLVS